MLWWGLVCVLLGGAELAAYFFYPHWLAKLAVVPIGDTHTAQLTTAVLPNEVATTDYRTAPQRAVTVHDLRMPAVSTVSDSATGWHGAYGWVRLRYKWLGWNRSLGIARINATVEHDRVTLRARGLATPITPYIGMGLLALVMGSGSLDDMLAMLLAIGLVFGMNMLFSYWRLRPQVESAMWLLAAEVAVDPRLLPSRKS